MRSARDRAVLVLLALVGVALVASLAYREPPPEGSVHTHHAWRVYAEGDWIVFPLRNYAVLHRDVHVEQDELAGLRGHEVVHVHRAGITFGDFLRSLGLVAEPGYLKLDDAQQSTRAVHQGESWADDAEAHWRLYVQRGNESWTRVPGDPVDYPAWEFGAGERLLLTYVPRGLADDAPEIRRQQGALVEDLWRWPQWTGSP